MPDHPSSIRSIETGAPADEELLEQFLAGDDRSYRELYGRYERGVLTYLRTILREVPEAADDLFQETFIKLFRERKRLRASGEGEYKAITNVRGWIFRVAHNLAISHLRSRRSTYSIDDDEESHRFDERLMVTVEESFASLYGDETERQTKELYERLRACVDLLPRSLREVYVLREINGLEYEEVAETLGCTQEAARMRLSRARRALRTALENDLSRNR